MTKFMLVFVLTFTGVPILLWSGGGGDTADTDGFPDQDIVTPAGEYPVTREPVTLEVITESFDPATSGAVVDFPTNAFTEWIEEKTGVSLTFTEIRYENLTERMNVLLAAGDLPDILMNTGLSDSEINYYGRSGLFRPFNAYIEEYGSVIKEVFEKKPMVKPMISDSEGNIYALPRVTECYHCFRGKKVWYYKPWMDQLGLEIPETTEEFYQMLKAVKTGDPNGNGEPDEIPYTGSNIGWDGSNIIDFITGSFIYAPDIGGPGFTLNAGTVRSAFVQPEYREALRYMNRLYEEELINDITFTMTSADYKRTVSGSSPRIIGIAQSDYPGVFADYAEPGESGFNFYPLSPLRGPGGTRYANNYTPYQGVNTVVMMSADNPYPAVTFRFLETFMLPEASTRAHIGLENVNWWKAPEGTKTSKGDQAVWVDYDPENPENQSLMVENTAWPNRGPTIYIDGDDTFGFMGARGLPPIREGVDPERSGYEPILSSSARNYYEPYNPPASMILPPLTIPDNLIDEADELDNALGDYIEQESVRFIRGAKSIENDWDAYIRALDELGLPRLLEIYQNQYEAEKSLWAAVQ